MNFTYVEQILVKQFKFPQYIARYILNFLWFEEVLFWQSKYNTMLQKLVTKPKNTPIHSHNNLLSMLMFGTFPVVQKVQYKDSSIIGYQMIDELQVSIDEKYYKFHTYLAKDKYF